MKEPKEQKTEKPIGKAIDLNQFMGRRVKCVRCKLGVGIGTQVLTGIDSTRHKVEMTLSPAGVLVKFDGKEKLLYANNIIEAELYPIE